MKKFVLLRENVVEINFLMKYALMGNSKSEDNGFNIQDSFVKFAKMFFEVLDKNDITEEDRIILGKLRKSAMDAIFEAHHEMLDDTVGLTLEHKLMTWNYNKIQRKEDQKENDLSLRSKTIEEMMDKARGRKIKSFDEL